jgi:hypothetical protein
MRRPTRTWQKAVAAAAFAAIALPARAQTVQHPASIDPEPGLTLPVAGRAERLHLLGLLEIYSVALYSKVAARDVARLASPDVAKALRIEIEYEEDFRRQLTIDWQRELIPPLNHAAIEHLRQTFAPLKRGAVVLIEYTPSKGTTVRVNNATVASGVNHDLMLAFLDHWLGQRPVSEELKRMLMDRRGSD